jgi:hypothetical protein
MTEIITDQEYANAQLREHAENINDAIDRVVQHEEAFKESTLEPCLLIGREIAQAQTLFGLNNHDKMAVAREGKALLSRPVTTEVAAPNSIGFAAWLAREIPRLNRATAIKYATCFKALELPAEAPPAKIVAKIKDLRHAAGRDGEPMPSLASLYKQGRPASKEPLRITSPADDLPDKTRELLQLEDAREAWTLWREDGEKFVNSGKLDHLDKTGLAELKEFHLWLRDRLNARLK